jgi:hypothetical protein
MKVTLTALALRGALGARAAAVLLAILLLSMTSAGRAQPKASWYFCEPTRSPLESRFTMTWDADEFARALKVTVQDVKEYFTDGRRVSFIIKRRLNNELNASAKISRAGFHARLSPQLGSALPSQPPHENRR